MNPVLDHIKHGPAAIERARSCDLNTLSAEALVDITRVANQIVRSAQALALAATAAGSRKEAHKSAGAASMNSLIAETAGISRSDAAKQVKLAEHLETAPVLAQQMTKPGMSPEKAHVVAQTMERLPYGLSEADRDLIESDLAQAAPEMSLEQLRRKAKRAIEVVDRERADQIENTRLAREEAHQHRHTSFWMSQPDEAGMVKGGFEIDTLTADMLRSIIESKTSPRASTTTTSDDMRVSTRSTSADITDRRSVPEKMGDAFCDILRHLPKDGYGNHGGVAATLMVTISEDSLRGRIDQAGLTDHGHPISAAQVRQIACNAGILPAVLNGQSQILDLGREQRLHTPAQRRALAQRDGGCAFPHCDRPPGWSEAHHIHPWGEGGQTSVDNGVLLCGFHHRKIHHSAWRIEINPHDKLPDFYAPGTSVPIRNTRYRPLVA